MPERGFAWEGTVGFGWNYWYVERKRGRLSEGGEEQRRMTSPKKKMERALPVPMPIPAAMTAVRAVSARLLIFQRNISPGNAWV